MVRAESVLHLHRPIDHLRPFIPAFFCPFTYLPEAAALPPAVHLRQNQLHALCVLEMIQFFEARAREVLGPLARHFRGTTLGSTLTRFMREEESHSASFAALNRAAAPDLYAGRDHCFVRVPPWTRPVNHLLTRHPRWFPFWPWLMIVMEEKALYFGRWHLRSDEDLEPHFVAIQREHIAEEAHHVAWDEELIEALWPTTSLAWRRANARLLAWLVREFFLAPKRGGARLLAQLAREFPAHAGELRALAPAFARLGRNPAWRRTAYSRAMLPRSLRLMEPWPELAPLRTALDDTEVTNG